MSSININISEAVEAITVSVEENTDSIAINETTTTESVNLAVQDAVYVGVAGEAGDSAYQVWLDAGNTGTEQDFLNSLVGPTGPQGIQGEPGADGTGGGGGGDIQVVSADITRVADGVATYTDIPELSLTVALGETKHLWYTLFYDEKSEGIRFQVSGVGRFNSVAGFPVTPSLNYFYDTSQAVGRQSGTLTTTFSPTTPSPVEFNITDSISNAPINVLIIRAMVHAPFEDVTVNIGFRATASGGSTLELKKGSSLEIK